MANEKLYIQKDGVKKIVPLMTSPPPSPRLAIKLGGGDEVCQA